MNRKKAVKLIVLSSLAILAGWALILPAVTNRTANEKLSDITGSSTMPQSVSATPSEQTNMPTSNSKVEELFKGTLRGINRQSSEGDITIVKVDGKTYVRLEDNFTVTNGPDLLVGLGNNNSVDELIGDLKANSGGQNYLVPDNIDINKFSQVFIHCRAFKYSFAVADLQKV